MNIEALKKIGSEWIKGDYHRIYFNELEKLCGLRCNYYKTGNISSASMGGESLSNARAREIMSALNTGKLWYDVKKKDFEWRFFNTRTLSAQEIADTIIEEIKRLAEQNPTDSSEPKAKDPRDGSNLCPVTDENSWECNCKGCQAWRKQ